MPRCPRVGSPHRLSPFLRTFLISSSHTSPVAAREQIFNVKSSPRESLLLIPTAPCAVWTLVPPLSVYNGDILGVRVSKEFGSHASSLNPSKSTYRMNDLGERIFPEPGFLHV